MPSSSKTLESLAHHGRAKNRSARRHSMPGSNFLSSRAASRCRRPARHARKRMKKIEWTFPVAIESQAGCGRRERDRGHAPLHALHRLHVIHPNMQQGCDISRSPESTANAASSMPSVQFAGRTKTPGALSADWHLRGVNRSEGGCPRIFGTITRRGHPPGSHHDLWRM